MGGEGGVEDGGSDDTTSGNANVSGGVTTNIIHIMLHIYSIYL